MHTEFFIARREAKKRVKDGGVDKKDLELLRIPSEPEEYWELKEYGGKFINIFKQRKIELSDLSKKDRSHIELIKEHCENISNSKSYWISRKNKTCFTKELNRVKKSWEILSFLKSILIFIINCR